MKLINSWMVVVLGISIFMSSCNDNNTDTKDQSKDVVVADDKPVYGGAVHLSEGNPIGTTHPHYVTSLGTHHVLNQVYEGLLKYDPKTLEVVPCIAESYEIDNTGKVYTFKLRKGIFFHNDPCFEDGKGRELKASDVVYSFHLLCSSNDLNSYTFDQAFKGKVLGAAEFREASKSGKTPDSLPGVKAIDDYTVQITLTNAYSLFPFNLAWNNTSIVPKEAVEMYGNDINVGTGPFIMKKENITDKGVVLLKNPNYYLKDESGMQLPYLDSLVVNYIDNSQQELKMFHEGKLDLVVGLPAESIKEVVENQIADFQETPPKYILDRTPDMAVQLYNFNLTKAPFNNVKVRKAISYGINRDRIVNDLLNNEAYGPGIYGITPPVFKGYDITQINGYNYDLQKAKKLLEEAGYPNGKGFPTLKLITNGGDSKNLKVAVELQNQLLTNLNINTDVEVLSYEERLKKSMYAEGDIIRGAWVADYPSPESFIYVSYGKNVPNSLSEPSFPNVSRYKNDVYDKLFDKAIYETTDETERNKIFMEAEQLLMDDAPFVVLWYEEKYRLKQASMKNYHINPLSYQDFTRVYVIKNSAVAEKK